MTSAVPRKPHFSVVLPTHDTRSLTLACLESILTSGVVGAEVVVVDDGSTDDTAQEVRERYPEVKVRRNEQAQGYSRAVNQGLGAASGDLLVLLNSDTEITAGAWEALEAAFERDPSLGIAGASLRYPDGRPQWGGGRYPTLPWLFVLASGLAPLVARLPGARLLRPVSASGSGPVDWVTGAAMAFRREVWTRVGCFDESFRLYCQDLDFCTRAREAGWEIAIAPEFEVVHHHGATIARKPGSAGRQSPEPLWRDLLQWGWRYRGRGWTKRAAIALRAGARLRLAGRALRGLCFAREAEDAWRRDSLLYRRALAGVQEEIASLDALMRENRPKASGSSAGRTKRS